MFIKIFMEELSNMWTSDKNILGVDETEKTGRVIVGEHSAAKQHEPLDASHEAQIMAKQVGVVFLFFHFKYDEFSAAFTKQSTYKLK